MVVLVEQPKAAPVQGDNILRVYKNVILGGSVLMKVVLIKVL